ncbi:MAG: hypothetical protein PVF83_01940 [Anaerolineales bacterium]|jgi:hypothetical protein
MKFKLEPWLKTILNAIILGLTGEALFTILLKTWLENHIPEAKNFGWAVLLIFFLAVLIYRYWKVENQLRLLGLLNIYDHAEETIIDGLKQANYSYWWFGTSAYYVLCDPKTREEHIITKPKTDFVFVTIDPECPSVVASQAEWGHQTIEDTTDNILETMENIRKVKERKINISWEGRSTTPTFRVVAINQEKVFVSFYEEGKLGPECKQLELDANSLLGEWFMQYVLLSRKDATRMRIERTLARYIFNNTNLSQEEILVYMKKTCPDDDVYIIERAIDEMTVK